MWLRWGHLHPPRVLERLVTHALSVEGLLGTGPNAALLHLLVELARHLFFALLKFPLLPATRLFFEVLLVN